MPRPGRNEVRIDALGHPDKAMKDGIDVRGYLHRSLLDNYEWGRWAPAFGLIAVDRETFARTPQPNLASLGQTAQSSRLGAVRSSQRPTVALPDKR